jgi:hypothetical protein
VQQNNQQLLKESSVLFGQPVGWLVGLLVSWLVSWLVGRKGESLIQLFSRLFSSQLF